MTTEPENREVLPIDAPPRINFAYRAALYFLDAGHYLFTAYNGRDKSSKFIAAPDVAAAFAGQEQDSGWFPAGVLRCGRNDGGPWYVFSAPGQRVTITLDCLPAAISIPLPRTVLVAAHGRYFIFALKGAQGFNSAAGASKAPLPNVYSDGRICWGVNEPPEIDARSARKAWELFFRLPFSAHLSDEKCKSQRQDVRKLLVELGDKRKFPQDELIDLGGTIGQVIEMKIGGH